MSKPSDMFKGELVENEDVPFENLAYATTDVLTSRGEGFLMYGTRELFLRITNIMDDKREFNKKDLFPEKATMRNIYEEVLKSFEEIGVLENLGEGKYRAKEKVHVERGRFKLPR